MNFLAHLLLADRVGADLAGAVLGDFVRGPDLTRFTPALAHSIRLHRRLDTITDQHPRVLAATARFAAGTPRRYAPIILDVLWDHALATDWPLYAAGERLGAFCRRSAQAIAAQAALFEGPRRPSRSGMNALLLSYATEVGIELALRRVAARLKQPAPMLDAINGWQVHLPALRADLPELIRDLEAAARDFGAPPAESPNSFPLSLTESQR